MTQPGQTDGFSAADHYRALESHVGEGVVDCMVLNSALPNEKIVQRYRDDGAELIAATPDLDDLNVRVVQADLLEDLSEMRVLWEKQDLLRHDPDKLGDTICRLFGGMEMATD